MKQPRPICCSFLSNASQICSIGLRSGDWAGHHIRISSVKTVNKFKIYPNKVCKLDAACTGSFFPIQISSTNFWRKFRVFISLKNERLLWRIVREDKTFPAWYTMTVSSVHRTLYQYTTVLKANSYALWQTWGEL